MSALTAVARIARALPLLAATTLGFISAPARAQAAGIPDCHILYIDRSRGAGIERILAQLQPRGTLTVSDFEGAALHGVAIELTGDSDRVRLVINADSAREAGLTISSSLLRLAASG